MQRFFGKLDKLAGIDVTGRKAVFLRRGTFICLILMTLFAPHSIAASQTAWLIGMLFWLCASLVRPRQKFLRTSLFIPFIAYFAWSLFTSVVSFAPDISLGKMNNVLLFSIFFFAVNNIRTRNAARFVAFGLVFSTMVNVIWTPVERLIGRGVEIHDLYPSSPLAASGLENGDTLLSAGERKIRVPDDLLEELMRSETVGVRIYRPDFYVTVEVKRSDLLAGETAGERLGIGHWKKSRNWRSAGFYGHYVTYSEVLQLVGSLALGLFVAAFVRRRVGSDEDSSSPEAGRLHKFVSSPLVLGSVVAATAFALLLTVTRASQLGFLVSAFVIGVMGLGRRMLLVLAAIALPVMIGGLIFLQQSRQVGFLDTGDASTTWRLTVYREGFDLWTKDARNFLVGVGMDSIKRYKEEWDLFDKGRLPTGHFHSMPLQLLVERGLPALLIWIWILVVYFRKLLRSLWPPRVLVPDGQSGRRWEETGILLGCLGAAAGFVASGMVHFNLGDSEVAMVFYLTMALAMALARESGGFEQRLNESQNKAGQATLSIP